MEYQYQLDYDWSNEEMVTLIIDYTVHIKEGVIAS